MTAHSLAQSINDEHAKAIGAVRQAIGHARRAGELLLKAKTACGGHGHWLAWMERHLKFSAASAEHT